ncbi:hypothetical protein CCHL11_02107 [Colletotrichum chlorophyti]|uniref:Uncharacterized protein n=1 Tax=Colletotrichum chlorophyti TaxID=708187 RepID=A0A1Q8S6I9_9PEZI|nr:hypothetical protein CCHL11_02107 [Colletotrichum chlorophyti]
MDPNPAPGAVPAVAGVDKVTETVAAALTGTEPKTTEPVTSETKPVEEKKDETAPVSELAAPATEPAKLEEPPALAPPTDAPAADAPKPASIEEVPDKEAPVATTGVDEPKAVPAEQSAATAGSVTETVKESVETGAQESAKAPAAEDEPVKEPIIEKPEAVNGAATKDVEMTGALNDAETTGAGEGEAAVQAVHPETKTGDKRKADEVNELNGTNGTNGTDDKVEDKPAEKKAKRGPGRPPSNGAAKKASDNDGVDGSPKKESPSKEKESIGHKVAKNVKKVLPPVGQTARKTRSQGPV